MMKKTARWISIALIAVLVLSVFAACGGEKKPGDILEGTWKTEVDETNGTWTWTFDGAGKCTLSCEETGINMEGTYQLDEEAKTLTAKMDVWDSEKVFAYTLADTTLDLEETYTSYHLTKQ